MAKESFFSKVRGISQGDRARYAKGCCSGEVLFPIREPENEYDPNAIAVYRNCGFILYRKRQIGYLSKDIARQFAPVLDRGGWMKVEATEVTGRGENIGLNIKITYNPKHLKKKR